MKKLVVSLVGFICLGFLLSNCKNNHSAETEKMKKDSVAKATAINPASAYAKYLTTPPDPDYTGDYIDKYPNGVIKFTGFFRFGKRHGQWMAFYENGIKWSECFYDQGKRHGASMVYYPNGKLQYSGWFKNDKRDSVWYFFNDKGIEVDRRAFKNDVETGLVN
jgi:hypothetical protein